MPATTRRAARLLANSRASIHFLLDGRLQLQELALIELCCLIDGNTAQDSGGEAVELSNARITPQTALFAHDKQLTECERLMYLLRLFDHFTLDGFLR